MALPASDDFEGYTAPADLGSQANWTTNAGAIGVAVAGVDNNAAGTNAADAETAAHWSADAFADDQYAEATIVGVGSQWTIGVGVRHATNGAATYYGYYTDATTSYLFKMVSGTWTELDTGPVFEADDVVRLEVQGTTLRGYINDVQQVTATDSDISSGAAGITGFGQNTAVALDNWSADNLGVALTESDSATVDEATTETATAAPEDTAPATEATSLATETTTPADTSVAQEAAAHGAQLAPPVDPGIFGEAATLDTGGDTMHTVSGPMPLEDAVTQRYDPSQADTAQAHDDAAALTIFDRSPIAVFIDRVSQRVDWVVTDTLPVAESADRFAPVELSASDSAGFAEATAETVDESPAESFLFAEATIEDVTMATPIDELIGFSESGEQGLGGDRSGSEDWGWGESATLAVALVESGTMVATQIGTRTGTAILHGTLNADVRASVRMTGTVSLEV